MWDGASKKPNITSTSTQRPVSINVESQVQHENITNPSSDVDFFGSEYPIEKS
jgi:hypothetical protein